MRPTANVRSWRKAAALCLMAWLAGTNSATKKSLIAFLDTLQRDFMFLFVSLGKLLVFIGATTAWYAAERSGSGAIGKNPCKRFCLQGAGPETGANSTPAPAKSLAIWIT